jgi:hypothetical protein
VTFVVGFTTSQSRAIDLDDQLATAVMEAARGSPAVARPLVSNILRSPEEPRALGLLAALDLTDAHCDEPPPP